MAAPVTLKPLLPYIKLFEDMSKRDKYISYMCGVYALQKGLSLDSKSKDSVVYLSSKMDELETMKSGLSKLEDSDIILNKEVTIAYLGNFIVRLFNWADDKDRKSNCDSGTVRGFYTASLLYDVLSMYGQLSDEDTQRKQYSMWRATYLNKCLQTGEVPGHPEAVETQSSDHTIDFMSFSDSFNNQSSFPRPGPSSHTVVGGGSTAVCQNKGSFSKDGEALNFTPVGTSADLAPVDPKLSTVEAFKAVEQSKKLCSYAMSSLQFSDVVQAVKYMKEAIEILTSYT